MRSSNRCRYLPTSARGIWKSDRWDKTGRWEAREGVFPAGGITSILYTLHVNQICRSDLSPPSRRWTKERPRSGYENWKSLLLLIPLVSPDNLNKFSARPRALVALFFIRRYIGEEKRISQNLPTISLSLSFLPSSRLLLFVQRNLRIPRFNDVYAINVANCMNSNMHSFKFYNYSFFLFLYL